MERITLRLPDDLHEALTKIAQKENRSLNSQILYALKAHVQAYENESIIEQNSGRQNIQA